MTKKYWQFLKPGDIVDIVAPSSNVPRDLEEAYKKTHEIITQMGLIARIPDEMIVPGKDPFSANDLCTRIKQLIYALTNETSKAVWPIRGGYGAAKIIPFLEKITPPSNAKLLLGFSDITALHLFLQSKWNWTSLHSPVINQLITNPDLINIIKPVIFGKNSIQYKNLIPLNDRAKITQVIEAEIIGGNLSILQTSLATSWQIQGKNKIIFIEEVGERGYRIDRMLNHLMQAGVFENAKAIIFGEITPELEPIDKRNLCMIAVEGFSKQLNIPVLHFPFIGHNNRHNLPLPFGNTCSLRINENYSQLDCFL